MKTPCLIFALLFVLGSFPTCSVNLPTDKDGDQDTVSAYVGSYTRDEGWVNGKGSGVTEIDVRVSTGRILEQREISDITNASFVVESADERYLYVVSELSREDEPTGFIHVLDVENNYKEISKIPTDGKAPCHIELDNTGNYVITTNYVGGVSKMYRRQTDGTLLPIDRFDASSTGRSSHLHSAQFSPDNRIVAIADLGLDQINLFYLDTANGQLIPHKQGSVKLADKAGPRHMVWSGNGKFLYVINELNSTINVLGYDEKPDRFTILQTIPTLPAGWTGNNSTADIHLHPNGKFLYGSNRGHNSIAGFLVDQKTGLLTAKGHESTRGDAPRNFSLSPDGRFLYAANQNSSTITVFSLNEKSGQLTYMEQGFVTGTPVCIEF
ncbi:lactonase family protein [Neolewinella persica]|uniref:lactonase family protein n=1 Tax=Neolewinella persica TaxID=70998 RepID=UPI00037F9B6F|nr:lactonase family protein [Neolewinella persica]